MQKVKNLLNPGGYKDDEVLYSSGESTTLNQAGAPGTNVEQAQVSPAHADAPHQEGPGVRHQHQSPPTGTKTDDALASGTTTHHAAPQDAEHPARKSIIALAHSRGEKGPQKELDPDKASGNVTPAIGRTTGSSPGHSEKVQNDHGPRAAIIEVAAGRGERGHQESLVPHRDVAGAGIGALSAQQDSLGHPSGKHSMSGHSEEVQSDHGPRAAIIEVAAGRGERGHQESLVPHRDVAGAGIGALSAQQDSLGHPSGKQPMLVQGRDSPTSHSSRGGIASTFTSQGNGNRQTGDLAHGGASGNPSGHSITETSSLDTVGTTGISGIDTAASSGGVGLTGAGAHSPHKHSHLCQHSGPVIHDSVFLNTIDPRVNTSATGTVIGGTDMDTHEFDDKVGRHHGLGQHGGHHAGRESALGVGAVGSGTLLEHEPRDRDHRTGQTGSTLVGSGYDQHTAPDMTGRHYPAGRDAAALGAGGLAERELAHRDKPLGHTHGSGAGDTGAHAGLLDPAHKGYAGRGERELENRDSRHTQVPQSTTDPVPNSKLDRSRDQHYGREEEHHEEKSKSGGLLGFLKRDKHDKDADTSTKRGHGHHDDHEVHEHHEKEAAGAAAVSGVGTAAHEDDRHHHERNRLHKDPPPGYIPAGYAEARKSGEQAG